MRPRPLGRRDSMVRVDVVTAPTKEPLTLAQAKLHLRVDAADEDSLIYGMAIAARTQIEELTGRCLMPTTLAAYFEAFPAGRTPLALPRPPLQSVSSVKYWAPGATDYATLDSAKYRVRTFDGATGPPGLVIPLEDWPVTDPAPDAVRIEYVAGYGNLPEPLLGVLRALLGHAYENREAGVAGTVTATDRIWASALAPFMTDLEDR